MPLRPPAHGARARLAHRALGVTLVFALGAGLGCGASVPARYVIEHDLEGVSYRRYQRVLDVELPIDGNVAEGHAATYVVRTSASPIPYVNAFVTVYERAEAVAAEVRAMLDGLASYRVRVEELEGGHVFSLDGGPGDHFFLWVSGNRVVKIGGTADPALVRRVLAAYLSVYPSDLDEHGRAREGTASAGTAHVATPEREGGPDLPRSLRDSSGGEASP